MTFSVSLLPLVVLQSDSDNASNSQFLLAAPCQLIRNISALNGRNDLNNILGREGIPEYQLYGLEKSTE